MLALRPDPRNALEVTEGLAEAGRVGARALLVDDTLESNSSARVRGHEVIECPASVAAAKAILARLRTAVQLTHQELRKRRAPDPRPL